VNVIEAISEQATDSRFFSEKVSKNLIDAVVKVDDRMHTVITSAIGKPDEGLSLEELQATIRRRYTYW